MRYTLWSHGRLVGHTDLDIPTVTSTMRQGFVEPTDEGRPILADATGVWRALAEMKRTSRARGDQPTLDDHMLVQAAIDRRESLDLELRDDGGAPFQCAFIRITDLFDLNSGLVDEMCDTEEEMEAAFQIRLSALSGEERAKALADRAEMDVRMQADIETMLQDLQDESDEEESFDSGWPPRPPQDPRWETMQYLLQTHLAIDPMDLESCVDRGLTM